MKNLYKSFIALALVLILGSCNIQSVKEYEKMQEQEQSIHTENEPSLETEKETEQTEKEIEKPTEERAQESTKEIVELQEEIDIEEPTTEAPKSKTTPSKEANQKAEAKTENDSTIEVSKKANKEDTKKVEQRTEPAKETTKPVEAKKRYVTITIRVDSLLEHWDQLDPSLQNEKYVPKSGIILKKTTYELLTEKDTVWDILQRAAKEHNIHVEYQGANQNIYSSVYVEGINHLYEFSAGPLSGWIYKVNGVSPNYGASQYTSQDGDVIEWHYTVDLGRDVK